ncbi:MAG TPA: 16S rRNA (guanine(527)-N(7))-methyltransferase RsmG [Candidatus Xenobia bacterium]|nr:16S rRNA (guanine(527)-N(7))-methyltransferase RsmG [Candidatus Xenobia bacterium]
MPALLSEKEIARELADYNVALPPTALPKLSLYLELLLRWNCKVNLTGLKDPRTIVRRLFAESLYAVNVVELTGWLVDIGSGAGFPGLALKLAAPDLRVTLIEARQKKCAFLKEVARQCQFTNVEVVADRFEHWARRRAGSEQANLITTRAVVVSAELLHTTAMCLLPGGKLLVFTTPELARKIRKTADFEWIPFKPSPCDPNRGLQVAVLHSK